MRFTVTDIDYFLAVGREGHAGKAAEACGVTQPAVSKALKRLEEGVGVPLVERGGLGMRLTSDGLLFLEVAQRFRLQHTELERAAADLRAAHAGLLRLGLTNPASDTPPVRALAALVRRRPGLRVEISIGKSDVLNERVGRGELDLAVAPSYPGHPLDCTHAVLGDDTMRVAARMNHPLRRIERPGLADLQTYAWVNASRSSALRQLLAGAFERSGLSTPRIAIETEYTSEAVMGLLSGTDLLGLVPDSILRQWVGRVEPFAIDALTIRRTVVVLARPGATWSALMTDYRDLLASP